MTCLFPHGQLAQFHMQSPAIFAQLNAQQSRQGALPVAFAGNQVDTNNLANEGRIHKTVSFGTYGMSGNSVKGSGATRHPHQHAMPTPGKPLLEHPVFSELRASSNSSKRRDITELAQWASQSSAIGHRNGWEQRPGRVLYERERRCESIPLEGRSAAR